MSSLLIAYQERPKHRDMIEVEAARNILLQTVQMTAGSEQDLFAAAGHRLARAVHAVHDHPLFDMSAVDGYAFAVTSGSASWRVMLELAAGDAIGKALLPGECARIFTGAMMPLGADTVVMQEHVERKGETITHNDQGLRCGANVRRRGEQLRAGDPLLQAGVHLGPAEIGLLASAGIRTVQVHARPSVSIVRTGGEFTEASSPEPGRIFSSNDVMLAAALLQEGIPSSGRLFTPKDERPELLRELQLAMDSSDVVITTGGVSVGEHDLVRSCLEELGAEVLFHGVRQKPGKPMLFARLGNTVIFGLPGNPRAVMIAWYEYVLPYLRAMQGAIDPWLRSERLPISAAVQFKGARAEFRVAEVRQGEVHLLADQGSHMLSNLIAAQAIAYFPSTMSALDAGDLVELHYLPER